MTDIQLIQQALRELPHDESAPTASEVRKLGKLIDGELPLQSFLEQLLPLLCGLFSAPAAVVWMKAQGARGAVFGVRYRMDRLLTSVAEQKKHERLVQLAWQQKQPMLAEPTGKATSNSASNPTVHPLMFGPIVHMGEAIALLEVVLGETTGPMAADQRQLYLRGIQLIAERVYGGLKRRMSMPAATLSQAVEMLDQLAGDVKTVQQQILRSIETRLQQFAGWTFNSLEDNQNFAKLVHVLLDSHGLRVRCNECGHPAILRCLRAGNAKNGAFVFDHYLDTGRTFHGGPTTVPLIRVVGKPARRPSLSNPA